MNRYSLPDILRFLFGIMLIQAATGILVYTTLQVENLEVQLLLGGLALILALIAALWFSTSMHQARKDSVSRVKDNFSREREKIKLKAERDKAKVFKQSHNEILKDRNRTQSTANLKVGLSFAGMLGLGGLMLFTQFMTMGMMLMTAAGGAAAGYALRTRQDYRNRKKLRDESKANETRKLQVVKPLKQIASDKAWREN